MMVLILMKTVWGCCYCYCCCCCCCCENKKTQTPLAVGLFWPKFAHEYSTSGLSVMMAFLIRFGAACLICFPPLLPLSLVLSSSQDQDEWLMCLIPTSSSCTCGLHRMVYLALMTASLGVWSPFHHSGQDYLQLVELELRLKLGMEADEDDDDVSRTVTLEVVLFLMVFS